MFCHVTAWLVETQLPLQHRASIILLYTPFGWIHHNSRMGRDVAHRTEQMLLKFMCSCLFLIG